MLKLERVSISYGPVSAVNDISLHVDTGETLALIGANGAGKSSLLKGILGLAAISGKIYLGSERVDGLDAHVRVSKGIALSPEGRHVFAEMTVEENLALGAATGSGRFVEIREDMFELFPRLAERRSQRAGSMSGGEQQMLAIARALMSEPKVLMLDEPTLGLAPIIVDQLIELIAALKQRNLAILLSEQNAEMALHASDRVCILELGSVIRQSRSALLQDDEDIRRNYLGI